jgi:hypothetical protein
MWPEATRALAQVRINSDKGSGYEVHVAAPRGDEIRATLRGEDGFVKTWKGTSSLISGLKKNSQKKNSRTDACIRSHTSTLGGGGGAMRSETELRELSWLSLLRVALPTSSIDHSLLSLSLSLSLSRSRSLARSLALSRALSLFLSLSLSLSLALSLSLSLSLYVCVYRGYCCWCARDA